MNIHHLELFYYVARHGGITEAVRNIPYGIQQPAVSGQVAQLEAYLGVQLFNRRPFSLTNSGEKLYKFISPFFSNLQSIALEIQGESSQHLRIGASTIVLRDHLPRFFRNVRRKYPNLKIMLREGYQADLEMMLQRDELDLAITVLEKTSSPGIQSVGLIELPLALLVERTSSITSGDQLWKQDRIRQPLICLPGAEAICRHFQQGLARLDVEWFPSLEVSSIDLIETYVANGFGIGISVQVPNAELPENVMALALPKAQFPAVNVGALWRGRPGPLLQGFLDELRMAAKRLAEKA